MFDLELLFFITPQINRGKKVCPGFTMSEVRYSPSLSQKLHIVYLYVVYTERYHTFVVSCLICSFAPNLEAFRQTNEHQCEKYSHYLTCFSEVDIRS